MYERFVELLQKYNTTPYKVSQATGISNGSLSDWKSGRSKPKYESLVKIAQYFGVSVDYLLCNEKQKEKSPSVTDEDIKIALFGGDGDVSDEAWEEVKRFAAYAKEKYGKK